MFEIFMVMGWAAVMILLLFLRADVRELSGLVKENRREMLRGSLSARANESFPNFQMESRREERKPPKESKKRTAPLNESEEQVLKEVLTEFLG
ncbi:MAG: hypothetical protein HFI29_15430 [Lachnospiraceae bacterium]|nr:hypothetical protein [Lachnospiraceae bacterium]